MLAQVPKGVLRVSVVAQTSHVAAKTEKGMVKPCLAHQVEVFALWWSTPS